MNLYPVSCTHFNHLWQQLVPNLSLIRTAFKLSPLLTPIVMSFNLHFDILLNLILIFTWLDPSSTLVPYYLRSLAGIQNLSCIPFQSGVSRKCATFRIPHYPDFELITFFSTLELQFHSPMEPLSRALYPREHLYYECFFFNF